MRTYAALVVLLLAGAAVSPAFAVGRVLVVINEASPASVEIGEYYASKRHIPAKYVCRLRWPTKEIILIEEYYKIRAGLRSYLTRNDLKEKIDYIVTTKGVPIRATGNRVTYSIDSMLTVMWEDGVTSRINNPYFGSTAHFTYIDRLFYLVTRLDGYTVAEARKLVDNSLAARPQKGLFLFDLDPAKELDLAFVTLNDSQRRAIRRLEARGLTCKPVKSGYPGGVKGLMGYFTWGSNHSKFDQKKYAGNSFLPGAIAETVVSSSGRTFNTAKGGQSLIADLIHCGVTGVKGYVFEPYSISIAQPHILFDRYTSGFNLAESFYAASPFLHWMDVVIGDPLCAPYAKRR